MGFLAEPQKSLVPIGGNFFATPDTPADPRDCDRYPNSPYCNGGWLDVTPIRIIPQIISDKCNLGVSIQGTLGFIRLPSLQIVHRASGCQLPSPPPLEFPPVANNDCARNTCTDERVIEVAWKKGSDISLSSYLVPDQHPYRTEFHLSSQKISNRQYEVSKQILDHTWGGQIPDFITNLKITIDSVGDSYNRSRGENIFSDGYEPNIKQSALFELSVKKGNEINFLSDTFTVTDLGDYFGNIEYKRYFYKVEYSIPGIPYQAQQVGLWTVTRFKKNLCEILPDPPPPPKKCMECCPCKKSVSDEALLKLILKRIGALPASVPDNFTKQTPAIVSIESLAELMLWQMQQLDALMGAYPIEIKIEDNDLTKEGNQEQLLKMPNQAELLAELLGLMVTIKRDTHATLITAIKAMGEAGMTKKLAVQTLDVGLANAEFLGYKLEQKKKEIPSLFTPGGENISATLKEKNIEIITYENTDKKDLHDDLKTLLTMAARWNAQNWRSIGKEQGARDLYQNIIGKGKTAVEKGSKDDHAEFSAFTEKAERGFIDVTGITDTTDPWGRPYKERPKVREIGTDEGRYNDKNDGSSAE